MVQLPKDKKFDNFSKLLSDKPIVFFKFLLDLQAFNFHIPANILLSVGMPGCCICLFPGKEGGVQVLGDQFHLAKQ